MQAVLKAIYPSTCMMCDERVDLDFALCPSCWRDTPFLTGLCCCECGMPLPGASEQAERCDDCLSDPRPWTGCAAVMVYAGRARALVMAMKHGDRTDIARAAGGWMAHRSAHLITPDTLVVPVPLHRRRLFHRRYNQAALLAQALARAAGAEACVDLLRRPKPTQPLEHHSRSERLAALDGAIVPHPGRRADGRPVLLVDDVMTSGATLAAATQAAFAAGAATVSVSVLARVAKDL